MSNSSIEEPNRRRFKYLEKILGYEFRNYENIEMALTHSSVRKNVGDNFHYERLEFLGDRVLGLVIARMLFDAYPRIAEGELSVRLNGLVNGRILAVISDEMELHKFVRMGNDVKQIMGKQMQSVRADVLEAVIASMFIDGGLETAEEFIDRFWGTRIYDEASAKRDSKTELQEWAHAKHLGTPKYYEKSRSGPDHNPMFVIAVCINGHDETEGKGRSKRLAEQDAACKKLVKEGVFSAEDNFKS